MNRKQNFIAIFAIALIALGTSLLFSCNADDEEYDFKGAYTMANGMMTRSGDQNYSGTTDGVNFGDTNYYYIPDALLNTSGCGYKAIDYALHHQYSIDSIKKVMSKYRKSTEYFPPEKLGDVIHDLTNRVVVQLSGSACQNNVSVGDIVCVGPVTIKGVSTRCGHATVVTSITTKEHYTLVNCYDECIFDTYKLTHVIHTSGM